MQGLPLELSRAMGGSFFALPVKRLRRNRMMTAVECEETIQLFRVLKNTLPQEDKTASSCVSQCGYLTEFDDYGISENNEHLTLWPAIRPEMRGVLTAALLCREQKSGNNNNRKLTSARKSTFVTLRQVAAASGD